MRDTPQIVASRSHGSRLSAALRRLSGPVAVAVPLREVMASDEGVVIGLIDCVAYPTGLEFRIAVRSKRDLDSAEMGFGSCGLSTLLLARLDLLVRCL